ncbi:hypothetical protein CLG94_10320 [Candidatus Methylomirabilis limnetica]|uniref:AAA+ ATPase domain-containing protein n=1 Tax=Candidatus Methylomirabilis limnetica TaxID=2033718 RepID=A0A2T4TW14_9BACT|nr:ATP-binding protein [Candidatus Methylomirabilis limnetica]PTL35293.1 hypothetical protein CLG94_10320 [Candidatus Methylomirabilis limnetica]
MDSAEHAFPPTLLTQPWPERLKHFHGYIMGHPHLVAAKDRLLAAIRELEPNSLVLVLGPTGVGKTTLKNGIEKELTKGLQEAMVTDPGRMPFISVEAVAPESGNFNWRDYFRRLLLQGAEPLVDHKRKGSLTEEEGMPVLPLIPGTRRTGAEYQHAVEQLLRCRRPEAVLIDEAQHLAIMVSGRKLSDQLDVIKSLANRSSTPHVLFGTYGLLPFRNLSGQLSRRSLDIHLPRYRADDSRQWEIFLHVLRDFESQLPLRERPDLVQHADFLYERSIGLVGVVKNWLLRTLAPALEAGKTTLTLRDLERHVLSVPQCQKILSEALNGEDQMAESAAERARLRTTLGLDTNHTGAQPRTTEGATQNGSKAAAARATKLRPGRRRPKRDEIGTVVSSHV